MALTRAQKLDMAVQDTQAATDLLNLADRILDLRRQWDRGGYSGAITSADLAGSTLEGIDPADIDTAVGSLTTAGAAVTDAIRETLERIRIGGRR